MGIQRQIARTFEISVRLEDLPESSRLPTIWIRRKRDGHQMCVNQSDWGGAFTSRDYEEIGPELPESDELVVVAKVAAKVSLYSESELKTLSQKELFSLPECAAITNLKDLKTKTELVAAILAVREAGKPKPSAATRAPVPTGDPTDDAETAARRQRTAKVSRADLGG